MKTKQSLSKSARHRLLDAISHAAQIDLLLTEIKEGADVAEQMPKIRAKLPLLNQAVHEFNAYHNALTTE